MSDEDIAAARKFLEIIANADVGADVAGERGTAPAGATGESARTADQNAILHKAREVLAFSERRFRAFGFSLESAFLLLLVLYTNEEWEPVVTITRLTQLSRIPNSTALRAVDLLVEKGFIERTHHSKDGRKTLLSLSPAGRKRIEDFFDEQR